MTEPLRPSTQIIIACTSATRWFDLDAVRTPLTEPNHLQGMSKGTGRADGWGRPADVIVQNPAGAPPLDWWEDDVATVTERLIAMMCPPRVCLTCGEPSRRIVEAEQRFSDGTAKTQRGIPLRETAALGHRNGVERHVISESWSTCGHDNWRAGRVLDPFTEPGDHMTSARLLVGDVRDRIREIPDHSIDLVCTSPPFLALRKYGDGPEMGAEPNPAAFIQALLELAAEFRRVLAPHGSIAVELGDTYAGDDRRNHEVVDAKTPHRFEVGRPVSSRANLGRGWPLAKSLAGVPEAYMLSLAYGWNVLDRHGPNSPAGRWRVRNVIVWARPNPPVGALGDKVRPATSYITVACVSDKRWFDLDAVREPFVERRLSRGVGIHGGRHGPSERPKDGEENYLDGAGAPPLDWWDDDDPTGHATLILPTQPYPGAHYATWPPALAKRLIEMLCPLRVCTVCGEPSRRIVDTGEVLGRGSTNMSQEKRVALGRDRAEGWFRPPNNATRETLGWTDCGCPGDHWRNGHVLDPFAGSGTTLSVAHGCGRDATGVELYQENAGLIRDRLGMFLELG